MSSTPPPKKPAKTAIDWAGMEPLYRAGLIPLKELGSRFGVTDAAIIKHARKNEWTRDLSAKIRARADAKVSAAAVSAEVSAANRQRETVVVEAVANQQATIRIRHQKNIARTSNLFLVLLGELEVTSNSEGQGLIEALMDACRPPKDDETEEQAKTRKRRNDETLQKVLSLPGRIESGKRLVEILERLTMLERIAHGIKGDEVAPGGEVAEFIKSISRAGSAFPIVPEPVPAAQEA